MSAFFPKKMACLHASAFSLQTFSVRNPDRETPSKTSPPLFSSLPPEAVMRPSRRCFAFLMTGARFRGMSNGSTRSSTHQPTNIRHFHYDCFGDAIKDGDIQWGDLAPAEEGGLNTSVPRQQHGASIDFEEAVLAEYNAVVSKPDSSPQQPFDATRAAHNFLDLLPLNGDQLPLTSLTAAVDLEAIADSCGSLVKFLQSFPHLFKLDTRTMVGDGGHGKDRWYIGRLKALTSDQPASPTKGENSHRIVQCSREKSALRRATVELDVAGRSSDPKVEETCESILEAVTTILRNSGATNGSSKMAMFTLRSHLLQREQIAESLMAVERHFGSARAMLRSWHGALAAVCFSSDGSSLWLRSEDDPPPQPGAVLRAPPPLPLLEYDAEYSKDSWEVDIDIDGEEPLPDVDVDDGEDHSRNDSSPAVMEDVKPAVKLLVPQSGATLQSVLAGQKKAKEAAKLSSVRRMRPPPPRTEGKTPPARAGPPCVRLVDLLVEIVPTFFVPFDALLRSEAVSRILGQERSIIKLLRKIPSQFDVDDVNGRVRLNPLSQHALRGSANKHYENIDREDALPRVLKSSARPAVAREEGCVKKPRSVAEHLPDERPSIKAPPVIPREVLDAVLLIPSTKFVPVECLGELSSIVRPHLETLLQHRCLIAMMSGTQLMVRLRPITSSPSAIGDFGVSGDLLIPRREYETIVLRTLRPIWTPLETVIKRLPPEAVRNIQMEVKEGECSTRLQQWLTAVKPTQPATVRGGGEESSVAADVRRFLLLHGRDVWVSDDGRCVRRFTGSAELDDMVHFLLPQFLATLPLPGSANDLVAMDETMWNNDSSRSRLLPGFFPGAVGGASDLRTTGLVDNQRAVVVPGRSAAVGEEWHAELTRIQHVLAQHQSKFTILKDGDKTLVGRYSPFRNANKDVVSGGR